MGRRSTKTTKTGKYMNPTDQWRKEQRRRELKKNKKQRTIVREAVLRMKDPLVLLQEIEEIEKMEVEVASNPLPNEKGLQEKKRKLHGNLDRIVKYWQKEDPKKAHEVKQLILDSEKKRRETTQLYDSYREARSQYNVSDIPMPESSDGAYIIPSEIPMPDELPSHHSPPPGPKPLGPLPPGPPPGAPPPNIQDFNIIESDGQKRSVRFAVEEEEEDKEEEEKEEEEEEEGGRETEEGAEESSGEESDGEEFDPDVLPESLQPKPAVPALTQVPPPPPGPPPIFAPRFPPPGIGIPPGPPPGMPPSLRPPRAGIPLPSLVPPNPTQPHIHSQAIISAPPTHRRKAVAGGGGEGGGGGGGGKEGSGSQGAVISAQPQLRNMQAEVTKFMPTSLRVRREVPKPSKAKVKLPGQSSVASGGAGRSRGQGAEKAKGGGVHGDAYEAFMREMQGVL